MTGCKDFSQVSTLLEGYRQHIIDLQRDLVAIPAMSPRSGGEGERQKADFLTRHLKDLDLGEIEEIQIADPDVPAGHRPTLICRIPGAKPENPTVWIMSHTDVVPAGDLSKWDSDPFSLVVDGDRLFGRGTEDNHQGLVASVMAARAFKEAGLTPWHNIALLFVADEETGSAFGITPILEQRPDLFGADDLILVPDGGRPDSRMIEVAEKSMCWTKFHITGKQCHASAPNRGNNAMRAGAMLINRVDEALHKKFDAVDEMFDPPVSTFEPTRKEANVPNINTIPGDDVFYFDCRILPCYKLADVLATMRAEADQVEKESGVKVEISYPQKEQAAPPTAPDAPIAGAVKAAVKAIYGVDAKPQGIGGGTVAAVIRRRNLPVVVWSTIDETMHGPNEYSRISNTINDAKVFARIICGCDLR